MKIVLPTKTPRIEMAWSPALCSNFFDTMLETVNDSTIVNYHNGLIQTRTYLRRLGKAPPNAAILIEDFSDMHKKALKKKMLYVNRRKDLKLESSGIVYLYYHRIYHGEKLIRRYYRIADRFKDAEYKGTTATLTPLTKDELFFCTSVVMNIFTASNYHRSGNLALIEFGLDAIGSTAHSFS